MPALVALPDVKLHLNIPESETTYDLELQSFMNAATPIIEYLVGPIVNRTLTETYSVSGRSRIMLRQTPVVSITSVTEYLGTITRVLNNKPLGSTGLTVFDFSLDNATSGLLVRRQFGIEAHFIATDVQVVYVAGRSSVVPDDVKLALLEDIRAVWSQTQVANRPSFGGGGVVQSVDNWNGGFQDLHMFPRLAMLVQSARFIEGIV